MHKSRRGDTPIGRVFLGRAIKSRPKIVAANFRNRTSMQPMRSQSHHGVKGLPFFFLWVEREY
jgi:hypothetical protein